jgi:hypothetical protein
MQSVHDNSRPTAMASPSIDLERLREVPGWFAPLDQALFGWCLDWQSSQGISGDLVELGVYKGKSAILLGSYLRDEETLIACDLFGRPASETDIGPGASQFYRDRLCRQDFETNYRSFFDSLPRIVEGPSSAILGHVEPGSSRFVHIDAAHRFSNVLQDVASARTMLCNDGIVVLDDYRTAHTPGVAAAVWESVLHGGLVPLCVSETKFYGTFAAAEHIRQPLSQWLAARKVPHDVHDIGGRPLIRVSSPKK